MSSFPLLSLIVAAPWAGAALLALLPRTGRVASRVVTLLFSLSTLVLGLFAWLGFDPSLPGYQWTESHAWVASLGIHYRLGIDGMSLVLILLTGIVGPVGLLASWKQAKDPRFFGILYLFLQGCALGVFLALDFFPWFLCWELSLVPSYFLIKLWGGPGASKAAYQFVVYTLAGSAFMLMGFAALYVATGTLDFEMLSRLAANGTLSDHLGSAGGFWPKAVFVGVFLGLAVKVPLYPFHTWLPSTYAEAPTGVTIFLTGVMSKMGVYGFLRILWPIFPGELARASGLLLWLALAGVVLGAFAALRQTDIKRLLAYSSINHVSFCLLALFAAAAGAGSISEIAALNGAILQMVNHGISAAALFYCASVLESRSGGPRGLGDFGGVRTAAPIFAGLCGISMFSSLGLPGLNGFVGEFLIFRGVFGLAPWAAGIACLGLLATAMYLLTFWQRVFHGPRAGAAASAFSDLDFGERSTLVPLVLLMGLFGVAPQILIGLFNPAVTAWAQAILPK